MSNNFIKEILRFFYPQESCLLCQALKSENGLCSSCQLSLPPHSSTTCTYCALPITSPGLCGRCLTHQFAFDKVYSAHPYLFPLPQLIQAFKYHKKFHLAKPLAGLMLQHLPPKTDILIPIPLHKQRLKERGFNQAQLLAKYLASHTHTPLLLDAVIRVRDTPKQSLLDEKARQQNLKGAFQVRPNKIAGLNITLVDDVLTSGTTLHTLASALKKAGANRVDAWVLARTHPN